MQPDTIFVIAVVMFSVVVHEISHGYVANLLGDPTARLAGRLTLNPLKHLDLFGSLIVPALLVMFGGFFFGWAKPVPYNPYNLRGGKWGPAAVAAAGPASNIAIAAVFSLLIRTGGTGLFPAAALGLFGWIALVNIMLAVFNLLPVAPLDGSKILFAVLPWRLRFVEEWMQRFQLVLFFVLLFVILNSHFLERSVYALFQFLSGIKL